MPTLELSDYAVALVYSELERLVERETAPAPDKAVVRDVRDQCEDVLGIDRCSRYKA